MKSIISLSILLTGCAGFSGGYVHSSDPTTTSGDTTVDALNMGVYFNLSENTEAHIWLGPRWINMGSPETGAQVIFIHKRPKGERR